MPCIAASVLFKYRITAIQFMTALFCGSAYPHHLRHARTLAQRGCLQPAAYACACSGARATTTSAYLTTYIRVDGISLSVGCGAWTHLLPDHALASSMPVRPLTRHDARAYLTVTGCKRIGVAVDSLGDSSLPTCPFRCAVCTQPRLLAHVVLLDSFRYGTFLFCHTGVPTAALPVIYACGSLLIPCSWLRRQAEPAIVR